MYHVFVLFLLILNLNQFERKNLSVELRGRMPDFMCSSLSAPEIITGVRFCACAVRTIALLLYVMPSHIPVMISDVHSNFDDSKIVLA